MGAAGQCRKFGLKGAVTEARSKGKREKRNDNHGVRLLAENENADVAPDIVALAPFVVKEVSSFG